MKQAIIDNLKNICGWKTNRKIVVFSVDDYGNVRLDSKEALESMDNEGIKAYNHFDIYDTLETRQDLEALFEVLISVKDRYGNHVTFTPFSLSYNIDFEAVIEENFNEYIPEKLPDTFSKMEVRYPDAYNGAWELWKEGMDESLLVPQFHGREHLNLEIFENKLKRKDKDIIVSLRNRSYSRIHRNENLNYGYTASFGFNETKEVDRLKDVFFNGMNLFEEIYGFRSLSFTPPAGQFSPLLESVLPETGIKALNRSITHKQFIGNDNYKREWNYTGKKRKNNIITLVRNVVFEPTDDRGFDPVQKALNQIEAAFRWNRPANISSHRVNFGGFIDEDNRRKGLGALKELLNEILMRWPEVEFMSVADLVRLMEKESR